MVIPGKEVFSQVPAERAAALRQFSKNLFSELSVFFLFKAWFAELGVVVYLGDSIAGS